MDGTGKRVSVTGFEEGTLLDCIHAALRERGAELVEPDSRPDATVKGDALPVIEVGRVVLNVGDVYGHWHHPSFVERLLAGLREGGRHWIARDAGKQLFRPVHVRDVATAVAAALDAPAGAYAVTDGTRPTVGALLRDLFAVAKKLEYPHERFPIPSDALVGADGDDGPGLPGYEPQVRLVDGLPEVLHGLMQPRGEVIGVDPAASGKATRFEAEADGDDASAVFEDEARFWDEMSLQREFLYANPHDWRFDVRLGNVMMAPVWRGVERAMKAYRPKTVLDLGCGSGIYPRVLAGRSDVRVTGIDLSGRQIAVANELAAIEGIADRARFEVANVLEYEAPEKVDMITAFGALHHFPDLDEHLPGIVARNLKPGGILFAVEPHHEEGYHPKLQARLGRIAGSRFRRFFDHERYLAVAQAAAQGASLRGESPAGREFHKEELDLDAFLRERFTALDVRYLHAYAPYVANTYVVYLKVRWLRTLARWMLPLVVRYDGWLSGRPGWRPWAAEAMYTLRWPGE